MSNKVLVIAEWDDEAIKTSTRQTITAAGSWGVGIDVLVLGAPSAEVLAQFEKLSGVERILHANAPQFAHPLAEDIASLLHSVAANYSVVIGAHTSLTRNALPRFAALSDVGMISEALEIHVPRTYVRPIYAGNLLATVENKEGLQVLTVRASRFAAATLEGSASIEVIAAPAATSKTRWVSTHTATGERPELTTARVVISGGRSLGSAERFEEVLGPLATQLGAALGATRAAVDAGYAPNEIQVGQTGTIVAPELYVAIGVSGAVQHTAGIKDSRIIVAINQDPDAAIFQVADYALVADLFEAVPELTAALQK